ncbi:MAG: type 1 glutamine amidotransferase [Pseudomonadota bacterium]
MPDASKRLIGILSTGRVNAALVDRFGEYERLFRAILGPDRFSYRNYWVVDGELPHSPDECDGWLITGSLHGAHEDHAWIRPLEAFIRSVRGSGRPLVGICFGHQIMAQALGGEVVKFDGGWALGIENYQSVADGEPVSACAVHQDQVVMPPPGATTILANDFCRHAALSYGREDEGEWARSYQFHPEFEVAWVAALIDAREGNGFDADTAARGRKSLADMADSDLSSAKIGHEIAAFLAG